MFSQQGLVSIGVTTEHKDGILVATQLGEIQFYNIEEPSLKVNNVNYDLKKINLVLSKELKINLGDLLTKGKALPSWSYWILITVLILLGFVGAFFYMKNRAGKMSGYDSKEVYGEEI